MENKKSLVALALVALVGIVGATFAYFTSTAKLTNEFTTGTYSTSVTEEFVSPDNWTPGTTTKKKVNVTNNGSVEVAVRASYTEKWTSADGTTLSGKRNGEQVAQFLTGSDWELATDGYYYYKGTLGTNETSSDFISSVTFNPNFELEEGLDIKCTKHILNGKITSSCTSLTSGYAGATYSLDIIIETIQADKKWDYTIVSGTVYEIGDVITIANESFNVISATDDTVTMLAKYNLDTTYRQSKINNYVYFSDTIEWSSEDDIDIQQYDIAAKTYVNNYVSYLKAQTGDDTLDGTLITTSELSSLCGGSLYCADSIHSDWLLTEQTWWTRTGSGSIIDAYAYYVASYGSVVNSCVVLDIDGCFEQHGIRPVITISKDTLVNL